MVCRALPIAAAIVLLAGTRLPAQQASTDDAALRAGARVSRVLIDPFPITFSRGDSIAVRISLVDSVGSEILGALWSLDTEGNAIGHRLVDSSSGFRKYSFSGTAPGSQTFWVAVQRPGIDGKPVEARLDSVVATVSNFAVARVEIENPEHLAYSGTTIQLRAHVFDANNTEIEDARVSWQTDDPCHARVMPDGAISFGAPAKITVKARSQGKEATKEIRVATNPVGAMDISPKSAQTRVGDVVKFRISAEDRRGEGVKDIAVAYAVTALDSGRGTARVDQRGFFVAEDPGSYLVRASAGDVAAEALVEVARRSSPTPVQLVGRGSVKGVVTQGLAVFTGKDGHDYAYTGSGAGRVYVWDVTDATKVTLSDSVVLDAAVAGDVRVSANADWAVVARSGGSGNRNGITVLDLQTPGHPRQLATLSDSLAGGIKSIWVKGSFAYLVNAGAGALDVVDLTTPSAPRYAGRWETRAGQVKDLRDVWGDEKNLYLAYGSDGMVILDIADKGNPTTPQFVSQLKWKHAAANSVVRAGRYVYIGEMISGCLECVSGPLGGVRIIDVSKIKEPVEVARYEVPEAGADQLSVEASTLFAAFRQGGVRLVDVTGELRGNIYREGRQVGWFMTSGSDGPTMVSSALTFKGLLFVIDANSGLWVLRHQRASRLTP